MKWVRKMSNFVWIVWPQNCSTTTCLNTQIMVPIQLLFNLFSNLTSPKGTLSFFMGNILKEIVLFLDASNWLRDFAEQHNLGFLIYV